MSRNPSIQSVCSSSPPVPAGARAVGHDTVLALPPPSGTQAELSAVGVRRALDSEWGRTPGPFFAVVQSVSVGCVAG